MRELKVLIFEHERIVAEDIKRKIRSIVGAHVHITHRLNDSLDVVKHHHIDLAILDLLLDNEIDGIRTRDLIASFCDIPLIILSSQPPGWGEKLLQGYSNMEILNKPIDMMSLKRKMCRLIHSIDDDMMMTSALMQTNKGRMVAMLRSQ